MLVLWALNGCAQSAGWSLVVQTELFEILTWAQLGLHAKPCALLDTAGYFEPLLAFLDRAVDERFLRPPHRAMLLVDEAPERLLDAMVRYRPPRVEKWIDRSET
jgi:predicted Rossmann-fold nucleotide-binding protein